jgi:hypothetical protein
LLNKDANLYNSCVKMALCPPDAPAAAVLLDGGRDFCTVLHSVLAGIGGVFVLLAISYGFVVVVVTAG